MNRDRDLLHSYATTRSEAAFAELVERHVGMVHAAALRQLGGDVHLAHDVAQGVFVDLARKAAQLPADTVLAAWLYTSTRFAAANAVRAERRRRVREQEATLMNQHDAAASDAAWQQIRPVLDDALAGLEPDDRDAVVLRFFRDKTFGEIGAELLLKEDTARIRVVRALEKLAAALRRRGVTSSAEALGLVLSAHGAAAAPPGIAHSITLAALHAASPAGVAGVVETVTFMSATKTLGTLAVCGVILLLVADLRSVRRETESLRQTASLLERRAPTRPGVAVPPAAIPPAEPAASAKQSPPPGALASFSDTNAIGDPEYGATIARRQRRYALANYRNVVDAMELSPADALRLKELIAARWLAGTDTSDVLDRMEGATPELRAKARAAAQAEAEQKTKDLLGAEGYARFQVAQKERTTQQVNWALFTDFWDAGVALTASQQSALVRALVGVESALPGAAARTVDPSTGLMAADGQLLEAAAAFLTPAQARFLRERKLADARYREVTR